jgi:hypothetical protein
VAAAIVAVGVLVREYPFPGLVNDNPCSTKLESEVETTAPVPPPPDIVTVGREVYPVPGFVSTIPVTCP